jgi:hypothetical protein
MMGGVSTPNIGHFETFYTMFIHFKKIYSVYPKISRNYKKGFLSRKI